MLVGGLIGMALIRPERDARRWTNPIAVRRPARREPSRGAGDHLSRRASPPNRCGRAGRPCPDRRCRW